MLTPSNLPKLSNSIVLLTVLSVSALANQADFDNAEMAMDAIQWLPQNTQTLNLSCSNAQQSTTGAYSSAQDINYNTPLWETRVSSDWSFFSNESQGKILVIDSDNTLAEPRYRYLSNGTQNHLIEPWSASKVFAFTGAMAKLREMHGIGADGAIGEYAIADLITSIHSYAPDDAAQGNSNAIASFFANIAGRDFLTDLFHKSWLNLSNGHVMFRGAYGTEILTPALMTWTGSIDAQSFPLTPYTSSTLDPGYRNYRCDYCGLTGNKAMTTLAMAEFLKRLAVYELDDATRPPFIESSDIEVLFFGKAADNGDAPIGGMMKGISQQLGTAIARAISDNKQLTADQAKLVLDNATRGMWRIYQKTRLGAF
ncbi:hypothetical protein [Alteromonas sp. KUL49]|uniref:hypothetical protein n=1 Tax=Alteromonas sp. KUL49 TaxID=2480798 RepID=UPI00102F1263|nr:hypothetical protein [Alteromonas sp. KUL49]TAP37950.1 hypothetical protein EYS00_15765 [Alteromonas sp. KUL49]GEA12817.1 hypothetical protein KUL49_31920 [Alteromonas sp. KUL49]